MNSGNGSDPTEKRRVAILDLGTNSFNLLIGDLWGGADPAIELLHTERASVKLGRESIGSERIAPEAEERGLQALREQLQKSREWSCEEVLAYATSAIRTASNGEAFLEHIEEKLGLKVELIDGDREAELIAEGVRAAVPLDEEPVLILDIGGGSSEFLIADAQRTHWKKSYRIGAARLLDDIAPSDPIREAERMQAEEALEEKIQDLLEELDGRSIKTLVGCSGSFESIAEMAGHRFSDAPKNSGPWVPVDPAHFRTLHEELLASKLEERYQMPGLAEMRAEMIVLGSIFIETVLRKTDTKRIITSYYSLREGALMERARKLKEEDIRRSGTDE